MRGFLHDLLYIFRCYFPSLVPYSTCTYAVQQALHLSHAGIRSQARDVVFIPPSKNRKHVLVIEVDRSASGTWRVGSKRLRDDAAEMFARTEVLILYIGNILLHQPGDVISTIRMDEEKQSPLRVRFIDQSAGSIR